MSIKSVMTALADQVRRLSGRTGALSIEAMTDALRGVEPGGGEDPNALPAGYTEMEYLQPESGEYINTGFNPKYNTRVVLDVEGIGSAASWVMGAKNENKPTTSKQFAIYRDTDSIRADYFGSNVPLTISAADASKRTTLDMNANIATMFGQTVTNPAVTSGEVDYPLAIFTSNSGKDGVRTPAPFKLYSAQVYDGDVLACDLVPVETASGTHGMYNKVTKMFHDLDGTITSATGEQATPVISVSSGGLITATAGDKTATKQLATKGATTITPSGSVQTAIAAGTYATGDIKVAAVSSGGKQVYSGTATGGNTTMSIDTTVTLASSDIFVMVYSGDSFGGVDSHPSLITAAIKNGSVNTITLSSGGVTDYGDGSYTQYPVINVKTNGITYSGTRVNINPGNSWYGSISGQYTWYLIRG